MAMLALLVVWSAACVIAPIGSSGGATPTRLQVSQAVAAPGTSIRIQAAGFKVAEYVELRVTDPAGGQTTIGRVIADGKGDVDAEVAPGQAVKNGVSLLSASGTVSGLTAAASIDVSGGSSDDQASGQPQWTVSSGSPESACEQCLLVHGQAP